MLRCMYAAVSRKRSLTYLVNDTVLAVSVVVVISASEELDTQQNAMRLRLNCFRETTVAKSTISVTERRFSSPLSQNEMEELSRSRFAQRTVDKSMCIVSVFREWCAHRNGC